MRLVHPFPSVLDGLVVTGVALVAGGDAPSALRLGLSMTALQCSIGAVNDVHDAAADVGRVPPKPIPSGLLTPGVALAVAGGGGLVGLGLAAWAGWSVFGLAVVVLAIGFGYDLFAKGTPWSWLPFALGIPILPVYGWIGAAGTLPVFFVALVPMAVLAGTALAIANGRADLERDRSAGKASIATRLGAERSWTVHVVLWLIVVVMAVGWLVLAHAPVAWIAGLIVAAGALLIAALAGRDGDAKWRERVWEAEAVAAALALVVWLVAVLATS